MQKAHRVTMMSQDRGVVVHAVDSTQVIATMEQTHKTAATASAALGRLLTAAILMSASLKEKEEQITLNLNGGGSAGTLVAIGNCDGQVRGTIGNPLADVPLSHNRKLNVGAIVGKDGLLTVIRHSVQGDSYTGQVPIISGEVAEDITHYFSLSEQIPTVCALGVLVNPNLTIQAAGGFLLQLLPGSREKEIDLIEKNIAEIDSVTFMLAGGMTPQAIAQTVLKGFRPFLTAKSPVTYTCNCSREKMTGALVALGRKQLLDLAVECPETELVCNYCNKKYIFSSQQLKALLP